MKKLILIFIPLLVLVMFPMELCFAQCEWDAHRLFTRKNRNEVIAGNWTINGAWTFNGLATFNLVIVDSMTIEYIVTTTIDADTVMLGINKVLVLDTDEDSYIYAAADDSVLYRLANTTMLYMDVAGTRGIMAFRGDSLFMGLNREIMLDDDNDSYFSAVSDDSVLFVSGASTIWYSDHNGTQNVFVVVADAALDYVTIDSLVTGYLSNTGETFLGDAATDTVDIAGVVRLDTTLLPDASQGADIGTAALPFNLVYGDSLTINYISNTGETFLGDAAADTIEHYGITRLRQTVYFDNTGTRHSKWRDDDADSYVEIGFASDDVGYIGGSGNLTSVNLGSPLNISQFNFPEATTDQTYVFFNFPANLAQGDSQSVVMQFDTNNLIEITARGDGANGIDSTWLRFKDSGGNLIASFYSDGTTPITTILGTLISGAATFSDLTVTALTGTDLTILLEADASEDNADSWQIKITDGDLYSLQTYAGGSFADVLTIVGSTLAADFPGALTCASLASDANVAGATYGSDGSISDAEFLYINTLSSNAQTQISGKADSGAVGYLAQAEAITGDWVNTTNPWAVNEIVSTIIDSAEMDTKAEFLALFSSGVPVFKDDSTTVFATPAQLAVKAPLASPTFTGLVKRSVTAGITAVNPGGQEDGKLITDINEVAIVDVASDAVTLPNAVAGYEIFIINNGNQILEIWPATGDDLGAGVNTATTLAAGSNVTFVSYDATNWEIK